MINLNVNKKEKKKQDIPIDYIKTEIGLIPKDWYTKYIGKLFIFKNGLNKEKKFFGYGTPIVNYMDVFQRPGLYNKDIKGRVSLTLQEIQNYEVKKGDVFFTRTSETVEEIGITSVMLEKPYKTVFSGFVLRARPLNSELNILFKKYCFLSSIVRSQIISKATYTTRALTNGSALSNILIPIPTLEEQHNIATALSDADNLIESLEKLITKKQDIKKATMQQLLTGKKRLPGFDGEWINLKIEDVADCLDNYRIPLNESYRANIPGPYPYCGANGIMDYINDFLIDDDVILMAEDGGHFDEYYNKPIAYRMKGKIWINNHAHILKAKPHYSQDFLFYSLVHKNILPYLAGGTRAKLNRFEMNKINIKLPKEKKEQEEIGSILTDIDNEIEALKHRLEKTKQIKQGMMQNLMSGKIRLNHD
jgi:type I restriction enzyme S subunit